MMSSSFTRNIYKHVENLSGSRTGRYTNYIIGDLTSFPAIDQRHASYITDQIHIAINSLRLNGWLDIEEFRLPSQFIDTRALFFKIDELLDLMPRCISDQKELTSIQRMELRPLIQQAISDWEFAPVSLE